MKVHADDNKRRKNKRTDGQIGDCKLRIASARGRLPNQRSEPEER